MDTQHSPSWHDRAAALTAQGWRQVPDDGFLGYVGPVWERKADGGEEFGFIAEDKHRNRSGVVQGGMLATLADRGLGRTVRRDDSQMVAATVQLDIHYIDSARIGEFIVCRARVLRRTAHLVFVSGTLEAEGRLVANMSGIWKIRRPR